MPLAYRMCGVRVETEALLGGRPPIDTGYPANDQDVIRFRISTQSPPLRTSEWVFTQPWLAVGRVGESYLLRFHDHAEFVVSPDGSEVVCWPVDGCPKETIDQLLVDQVLPQVLHLRGQFCLHASSVATSSGQVVALLGEAGSGKSTLAASLARELSIVSDDCLAVSLDDDRLVVHPSQASARLWPDSAAGLFEDAASLPAASPRTNKVRVELARPSGPLELLRIYLLERSDAAPSIIPVGKRDAVVHLANNLHRLDPGDRRRMTDELPFLDRLVRRVRVARLAYRHSFDELPAVHRAIHDDLER